MADLPLIPWVALDRPTIGALQRRAARRARLRAELESIWWRWERGDDVDELLGDLEELVGRMRGDRC